MSEFPSRIADALFVAPGQPRYLDPVREKFLKAFSLSDETRVALEELSADQFEMVMSAVANEILWEAPYLNIESLAYRVAFEVQYALEHPSVHSSPEASLNDIKT